MIDTQPGAWRTPHAAGMDRRCVFLMSLAFARDDAQREPRMLVDFSALLGSVCKNAIDAGGEVSFLVGVTSHLSPDRDSDMALPQIDGLDHALALITVAGLANHCRKIVFYPGCLAAVSACDVECKRPSLPKIVTKRWDVGGRHSSVSTEGA